MSKYTDFVSGGALDGTEVFGPVRQRGQDVTLTAAQLGASDASLSRVKATGASAYQTAADRAAVLLDPRDDGADMTGATDSSAAVARLISRITALIPRPTIVDLGGGKIQVGSAGQLYVGTSANVTIRNGTFLVGGVDFNSFPSSVIYGYQFNNLTLENLEFDHINPPFMQGFCVEVGSNYAIFDVAGFWAPSFSSVCTIYARDPVTFEPIAVVTFGPGNNSGSTTGFAVAQCTGATCSAGWTQTWYRVAFPAPDTGVATALAAYPLNVTPFTLSHRNFTSNVIAADGGRNLVLRNVAVRAGCGAGLFARYTERVTVTGHDQSPSAKGVDLVTNKINVSRWQTTNVDALHFDMVSDRIDVLNSTFGWCGDDAMNVVSREYQAFNIVGLQMGLQGFPGAYYPGVVESGLVVTAIGDQVSFTDPSGLPQGVATITAVVGAGTTTRTITVSAIPSGMTNTSALNWRINLLRYAPEVRVSGNRIGHNRGRGVVGAGRNVEVRGNRIVGTFETGIEVGVSPYQVAFAEGEMQATGIVVDGNTVERCAKDSYSIAAAVIVASYTPAGAFAGYGAGARAEVTNNTVRDAPNSGYLLSGFTGAVFGQNRVSNVAYAPNSVFSTSALAVVLMNCASLRIDGNSAFPSLSNPSNVTNTFGPMVSGQLTGMGPDVVWGNNPGMIAPGAWADGAQPAVVATIGTGSTVLTVATSLFTAADAGKYIEVPGAGAAGATLVTTIASYSNSTTLNLTLAASTALAAATVTLTYGHDDTVAIQAALNTTKFLELVSGKTYLVKNLTIPSSQSAGTTPLTGIVARGGYATIRAIAGGDPTYLIATQNWVANGAFADYPVLCKNIIFDAGKIARDAFTNQSFGSIFDQCFFRNATRHGCWLARTTKNATPIGNNTSNNQFQTCGADSNGADGIHGDATGPTDSQVRGGYWFSNGGYGLNFGYMPGTLIQGTHTYSNTLGGLYADYYGFNTSVSGCIFEDAVKINSMSPSSKMGTFGPGNSLGAIVTVMFTDNVVGESFRSLGNNYYGVGQLYNGYNGQGHSVISEGDNFQVSTPFIWASGLAGSGTIIAKNCYVFSEEVSTGLSLLDGLQVPGSASGQAPNEFNDLKYLSNTGTTTTLVITATVASNSMAGFVLNGTLDIWSLNVGSTLIENYTTDIRGIYMRQVGTASVKQASLINTISTGATVTVAIAMTDVTVLNANNTVTLTITITHPQAPDQYSSSAMLTLKSRNRSVVYMSVA